MKNKIKYQLILITALFLTCIPNLVSAAEIVSRDLILIDGKQVNKFYDNTETGATDYVGGNAGKVPLLIDGKEYMGFCIDFGMLVATGTSEEPQSLSEYFQNVLSESETKDLIKKLTLYTNFGYGYEGRSTDKYYLATQKLIWEAISDTGFYASDFYHSRLESGAKKKRIANFRWTNDNGKTTIDISSELNAIQNSIRKYYEEPSFCSSQNKIEIEVGESATFKDSNNVLSQYKVTCDDGIKCEVDGDKLTVTAIDEAASQRITFSKAPKGSENYVYRVTNRQGLITSQGTLEPITCEFGIDSFKNVQTADIKILYVITIGLFCGIMAYIAYYTKKTLSEIK